MEIVAVAVVYLATVGGFLYLLAAVIGNARIEREQVSAYFTELLLQVEAQAQDEREAGILERNSLLERIQRPEFIPPAPSFGPVEVSNEIQDDLHLVGTIKDTDNPLPPDAA
jgi:hypothetical protein